MAAIHISKPGRVTSAEGVDVNLTPAILREAAQTYNPDLYEAQLVIGHPSMAAPSYGGVRALSFGEDGLEADADPTDNARDLVARRHYKGVSASFYTPTAPGNPVPGKWYLRHVGLLGAAPPAVKGLRALSFAEAEDGVLTFGDLPGYAGSYMASMLRKLREWFIDKEGLETADRVLPSFEVEGLREASQRAAERNDQISGGSPALSFAEPGHAASSSGGASDTKLGAMLQAAIDKLVDDKTSRADIVSRMANAADIDDGTVNQILRGDIKSPPQRRLRGFARVLGISAESMTNAIPRDLREVSFAESPHPSDQEIKPMTKTVEQMQAELDAANTALQSLQAADTARQAAERQSATDARHAGHVSFAEGLVSTAKWPVSGKDALVAVLDVLAAPADAGVVSFGEGDAKKPLADVLREQLQALPASVSFGEFARGGAGAADTDPGAVAARALAYQTKQAAKGERVNTAQAVAHVSRSAA